MDLKPQSDNSDLENIRTMANDLERIKKSSPQSKVLKDSDNQAEKEVNKHLTNNSVKKGQKEPEDIKGESIIRPIPPRPSSSDYLQDRQKLFNRPSIDSTFRTKNPPSNLPIETSEERKPEKEKNKPLEKTPPSMPKEIEKKSAIKPTFKPSKFREKPLFATYKSKDTKRNWKKIIISFLSLIVIFGVSFYFFWTHFIRIIPAQPPILPQSLVAVEKDFIISLDEQYNEKPDSPALADLLKTSQPSGTFNRVLFQKFYRVGRQEKIDWLSLDETFKKIGINKIPLSSLKDDYSLFIYNQNGGKRLGLVIAVDNLGLAREQLLVWEDEGMISDLNPLIRHLSFGQAATRSFQDNIYRGIKIRYMNFPDPDVSIDYALLPEKNYLLISTSKESMYQLIDRLLSQQNS